MKILILLRVIAEVQKIWINNTELVLSNTCSFTIFGLKGYLSSAEIAL